MLLKIKEKVRRLTFPKFKTHYKETVTKKKKKKEEEEEENCSIGIKVNI